jgi:circadian clock protein KaiC
MTNMKPSQVRGRPKTDRASRSILPVTKVLEKAPSGIRGLDEIMGGGLPRNRPTLVCGSAGCGKTILAMEFLVRGAMEFGENGAFIAFEESAEELAINVASMGFDLDRLVGGKKLSLDHVFIARNEIEETGEYDLEGLFVRIRSAVEAVGARRIVLDSMEALFAGLPNPAIVRSEIRRLFHWLKERKLTAIVTAEKGDGRLTRNGLEEYVSDCVIVLENTVTNQISTRRVRVVKYRGSAHGSNEYPFLIGTHGISVLPVTSLSLAHKAPTARISSGIAELDQMLGGKGYFRGSTILLSGTAGSGKTSVAATFAAAACRRNERCLYLAFEESPDQITRNMKSLGLDLAPWVRKGLLRFHAERPNVYGLEMHLAQIHSLIEEVRPHAVVVDPLTSLQAAGAPGDVKLMLMRLADYLKGLGITTLFISLTGGGGVLEATGMELTSLVDTWLLVRNIELGGERNRGLYVLKSRGMEHSNQIREFLMTGQGIRLRPAYLGQEGALTGSARLAQEARERAEHSSRDQQVQMLRLQLEAKEKALAAQLAGLQAQFRVETEQLKAAIAEHTEHEEAIAADPAMAVSRGASPVPGRRSRKGGTTA